MRRSFRRWLAILMLAVLGFAQASVALAACAMDRGGLAQAMAAPEGGHDAAASHDCCNDEDGVPPSPSNTCVAHCTFDLQAFGWAGFAVPAAGKVVLVLAPGVAVRRSPAPVAEAPPPRVPPRILLHSFLI